MHNLHLLFMKTDFPFGRFLERETFFCDHISVSCDNNWQCLNLNGQMIWKRGMKRVLLIWIFLMWVHVGCEETVLCYFFLNGALCTKFKLLSYSAMSRFVCQLLQVQQGIKTVSDRRRDWKCPFELARMFLPCSCDDDVLRGKKKKS